MTPKQPYEALERRVRELEEETGRLRRVERELRENEEKYRTLVENVNIGVYRNTGDPRGRFLQANPAIVRMFGYDSHDEFMKVSVSDLYQIPEDRRRFIEIIKSKGFAEEEEIRLRKKDGTPIWCSVRAKIKYDDNGDVQWMDGVIEDITERKRAEEELRRERDKAQKYLDVAGVILTVINADQTVALINKKGCNVLGYSEEEIVGRNWFDMFVPENLRSSIKSVFTKLMNGDVAPVEYFENPVVTKTGAKRVIAWHNTVLTDELNTIIGALSSGEDITERKAAEEALQRVHGELEMRVRERTADLAMANEELKQEIEERKRINVALRKSEERYRTLVEDMPALICRFLPDGMLSFVNNSYCEYLAARREALEGADFFQFIPAKDQGKVRTHFENLTRERPVITYEHQVVSPKGEILWQRWTDRALFDEKGSLSEYQSVGFDITDRMQAEEALRESEKQLRYLSTQLVTAQEDERKNIAQELHDSIGQILTTVKFGVERAIDQIKESSAEAPGVGSLEPLVPLVRNGIEEIRKISTDLWPSILDDLGILATISWFCREFQKICPDIIIEKHIDVQEDDVPMGLKIVIYRILQEAVNNIAKHSNADSVCCSLRKTEGAMELFIEDNGKGFDVKDILYKDSSKRGFGLASMKKRTEMSGGSFVLESVMKGGTTVRASWRIDE